jgi:hypothetical protein
MTTPLAPNQVATRAELVLYLEQLSGQVNTPDIENPTLDRYLEAMSGWLGDLDGYFAGRDEPVPDAPSWALVAQLLTAALFYE